MRQLAEKDSAITQALQLEYEFFADPAERERYFQLQRQLMDEWSRERSTRIASLAEGEQIGITKGLQTGIRQTAVEMKREGLPIEQIARITKLSVDEIQTL